MSFFLRSTSTFSHFDQRLLSRLADIVEVESFEAESVIIAEGCEATAMYIIKSGEVVLHQELESDVGIDNGKRRALCGFLKPGQYFGERALVTSEAGSVTATAVGAVKCLRIARSEFESLFGILPQGMGEKFTPRVSSPAFIKGGRPSRHSDFGAAFEAAARTREDSFSRSSSPSAMTGRKSAQLSARALASPVPTRRGASPEAEAYRLPPVLSREAITSGSKALPPSPLTHYPFCEKRNVQGPQAAVQLIAERQTLSVQVSPQGPLSDGAVMSSQTHEQRRLPRNRPRLSRLQTKAILGRGGFGRVELARDSDSRRHYALKIVTKRNLLASKASLRTQWLLREKQCLEELSHTFIVELHATYADEKNLYFLFDLAIGGELFRILDRLGKLPETATQFYIGSLALALAHIHSREYVYRDLKPENVLIDQFGFVKLCDFGFAKKVVDRTYTQCGTPDYVAPEMLKGQGVNQAADWWALGVVLYEALVGYTPFTNSNGEEMKTFEAILNGEFELPEEEAETEWAKLVSGLCAVKVSSRLGYLSGGAEDVICHAWFGKYDWDGLVNRTITPPWRPQPEAADDTRYFDIDDEQEAREANEDSGENEISEHLLASYQHVFLEFVR